MKVALVHDYLNQFGGAERVVEAFLSLYPNAPLYTSICDNSRLPEIFSRADIRTSFMQNLPFVLPLFRQYFFLYPLAFEQFDLSGYDVILSSSSAFAKGIKKKAGQIHICYCHTPMRFVWRHEDYVKRENIPSWAKAFLPFVLEPIKSWDLQNTMGVDYFIANSSVVSERIRQIYGRESVIINPPVDTGRFQPVKVDRDYYLVVSRLSHYKRIDLAVEAFNRLELPLKIIGAGPAEESLKRQARSNIEFLGRLSDKEVAARMSECRALIFPGEEDFGIVPLEAMSCGRPVIAYAAGGALETIVDGETGAFFHAQTPQALIDAVENFRFSVFDKRKIREHAARFDEKNFMRKIKDFVKDKYEEKSPSPSGRRQERKNRE